ncbi:hypothetical protein ABW21_db0205173 [Orbilia brochopaga]|nr:hypothetical protein ABW21_db0205173 [Drechslerella brochopaga]
MASANDKDKKPIDATEQSIDATEQSTDVDARQVLEAYVAALLIKLAHDVEVFRRDSLILDSGEGHSAAANGRYRDFPVWSIFNDIDVDLLLRETLAKRPISTVVELKDAKVDFKDILVHSRGMAIETLTDQ